jgi:hypothetical protein
MESTFEKGTITGSLGITDQWADSQHNRTVEILGQKEEISEVLEFLGREAKWEELGVNSNSLTTYEKKLLMAGFFTGSIVAQSHQMKLMLENPMEFLFKSLGKG